MKSIIEEHFRQFIDTLSLEEAIYTRDCLERRASLADLRNMLYLGNLNLGDNKAIRVTYNAGSKTKYIGFFGEVAGFIKYDVGMQVIEDWLDKEL